MRRSDHPNTCQRCHGTGWEPADPITEIVNGEPHHYDTYRPCTHHWTGDNPDLWEMADG